MRIQLLFSPDCPNVDAARANLRAALAAAGAEPRWDEVDLSTPDAAHLAGHGSPAVLVDGRDVAGHAPADAACCRVYRRADGSLGGAPDTALIAKALSAGRPRRWLPAWVGGFAAAAVALPSLGLCPACWPAYVSVLAGAGLPFAERMGRAMPYALLAIAVLPLMRLIVRRRAREAGLAVTVGAALILEARWLDAPALGAFGALLVILGAFATMGRGRKPPPVLIQLGRR